MCCDSKPTVAVFAAIMIFIEGGVMWLLFTHPDFKAGQFVFYFAFCVKGIDVIAHVILLAAALLESKSLVSLYQWYLLVHMVVTVLVIVGKLLVVKPGDASKSKGSHRSRRHIQLHRRFWDLKNADNENLMLKNFPYMLLHIHAHAAANNTTTKIVAAEAGDALFYFGLISFDVITILIDMLLYSRLNVFYNSLEG